MERYDPTINRHRITVPYSVLGGPPVRGEVDRIRLIGSGDKDWRLLRDLLQQAPPRSPYHSWLFPRIEVLDAGNVAEGDNVVFFISSPDGPMQTTLESIAQCAGRTIRPIAIILTRVEQVNDPSLLELVKCEFWNVLTKILPMEVTCRLPLFYDSDPDLGPRISALIKLGPPPMKCQ